MISLGIDLFMVDTSSKKSSDSALKEWIARTEAIEVRKNLQYFKQSSGRKVDKTLLADGFAIYLCP